MPPSPAGAQLSRLTGFPALGPRRSPWSISTLSNSGQCFWPVVSRSSCHRSVSSNSFGQHNSRVLYQLPRRNSLPLSLSSGNRALGVVYSEGNPSFGRSHSGGGQLGSRLPIQREVSPIRMDSESFDFSEDLSGSSPSSGDRPVCVHPQFSISQVLCPLQGSSFLEGGRTLLPVVSSSTVRLPTLLGPSHSSGEGRSGRSGHGSGGPFWPQRPWFLKLLSLLAGHPRVLPLQKDLVYQPMSRQPHPRLESIHLTLWPLSGRKESRRAFLLELQSSQRKLLGSQHELLTIPSWNAFSSGVTTSLVTPILPL